MLWSAYSRSFCSLHTPLAFSFCSPVAHVHSSHSFGASILQSSQRCFYVVRYYYVPAVFLLYTCRSFDDRSSVALKSLFSVTRSVLILAALVLFCRSLTCFRPRPKDMRAGWWASTDCQRFLASVIVVPFLLLVCLSVPYFALSRVLC
jgi:hypothetical protein